MMNHPSINEQLAAQQAIAKAREMVRNATREALEAPYLIPSYALVKAMPDGRIRIEHDGRLLILAAETALRVALELAGAHVATDKGA